MSEWIEKEIKIEEIEDLLKNYEVEIFSPDGYVTVDSFINKGSWEEYQLHIEDKIISVNENHLFETEVGWEFAKNLTNVKNIFLTENGMKEGNVVKTNQIIPIVDIQVNHQNHRYYADGVSSHNTNVGKTGYMCSLAANYLKQGFNVVYFTMEMAREKISQRIDANLLDVELNDFEEMPKERFKQLIERKVLPLTGEIKVEEFPTSQATVLELRSYLDHIKQKDNFVPNIIFVDYLTIMNSARYRNSSVNSYTLYKAVAEELRGLAVETNTCMWTGLQFNRGGFKDSDSSMTDIAESFGVPMTLDYLFIASQTDELKALNQLLIKQEKSRYDDVNKMPRFVIGFDKAHMRFYDLDDKAQDIIYSADLDDKPDNDKKFKFSF